MSISDQHDRTDVEDFLLKAVRRGKLAMIKAMRIAQTLKRTDHKKYNDIEESVRTLAVLCSSTLEDVERCVGRQLEPTKDSSSSLAKRAFKEIEDDEL